VNGMLLRPWRRPRSAIARLRYREQGQTIIEYALLVAAIAVLLIVGMLFLGGRANDHFPQGWQPAGHPETANGAVRSELRRSLRTALST
jgi:Flp pilus assembly pilin Flp